MKISNSYPYFTSKKPLVKKADDIVRHTNLQYPAFSPSAAARTWISAKYYTKNRDREIEILEDYAIPKLCKYRIEYDKAGEADKHNLDILRKVKNYKIANCAEKSWFVMAALAANGYTHFTKVSTMVKIKAIDKRTGEKVFAEQRVYDHCMVATTMEDKGGKIKESIILDPWLNKAMTYNEAQVEYLKLISRSDMKERMEEFKNMFIEHMTKDYGVLGKKLPLDFNIENYEFIPSISLSKKSYSNDIENPQDAEEFGKLVKQEFSELIL